MACNWQFKMHYLQLSQPCFLYCCHDSKWQCYMYTYRRPAQLEIVDITFFFHFLHSEQLNLYHNEKKKKHEVMNVAPFRHCWKLILAASNFHQMKSECNGSGIITKWAGRQAVSDILLSVCIDIPAKTSSRRWWSLPDPQRIVPGNRRHTGCCTWCLCSRSQCYNTSSIGGTQTSY